MLLVSAEEMREIDRRTIEEFGIPGRVLMENAGRGATRILLQAFSEVDQKTVGVAAGPGNNGGDGFVMARCLSHRGISVTVFLLTAAGRLKGDALTNFELLAGLPVDVVEIPDQAAFSEQRGRMREVDIWVDAILGTGLTSDVKPYFAEVIHFINSLDRPVFAVDIPSGLSSETGRPCGVSIQAHTTATFAFAKMGQLLAPGAAYTGHLQIVDIGVPPHIPASVLPRQSLLTRTRVRQYFHRGRPMDAHKGHTGHVLAWCGSAGKTGAAALTAAAAMHTGAGLVTLAVPAGVHTNIENLVLEAMSHSLPESQPGVYGADCLESLQHLMKDKKCFALGPGIGTADDTRTLLRDLLPGVTIPMVIDADGLNLIARDIRVLKTLSASAVLTPHPGEMARLSGRTVAQIQADRIQSARDFAVDCQVHLVLKGARTVVAHPDGRVWVNPTGNSGMASGGMGDVLTGMIAGFIAQGFAPEAAAHAGVFLHGAAADTLAAQKGPWGYLASEVSRQVPAQIRALLADPAPDPIEVPVF